MNMGARNQRFNHRAMRRAGALALALMMLTLPIAASGAFALTSGDESQLDIVVIRGRQGQYLEAFRSGDAESAGPEPFALTSGVDPMGPVHGGGYAISAESELFALTSGVDPSGPVHGGGYATLAESDLFALTSGVDPSGPVHGSSLSCLAQAEPDMLC
jgi:hypothetical protein